MIYTISKAIDVSDRLEFRIGSLLYTLLQVKVHYYNVHNKFMTIKCTG